MSEEIKYSKEHFNIEEQELNSVIQIDGMYESWFLDYASYVILERAVPDIYDGLKPVQRRILHSLKEMDDGRYNKVANVIGNTMKYHPHGDASIGDALVNMGQKDLLIDMQGNWGNILTGDRAAAPRYIESRLSKFALEVVFNRKITKWTPTYDGRTKEPIVLPVKFPLLLAQGVEGIAVGLSTKIMPHNFLELIDASISILKGRGMKVYPDFTTGGIADFSHYKDGKRGGKIKVRARIEQVDSKQLKITEIPFATTTSSLIESIIRANEKGKIKIKKIEDNTAEFVEIIIHLPSGVHPDKMIDALYAFSDCEISISPNACIIKDDKPYFMSVSEILKQSTDHTLGLLKAELEILLLEQEAYWHFASLERIFIENKIYRDIEECETWDAVIQAIRMGLSPHIYHLQSSVSDEEILRLTEIKIKRISKFDLDKANEDLKRIEDAINELKDKLSNLVKYAINYFKGLKKKYKHGKSRKTEVRIFETIVASKVAIRNQKLYLHREEGFMGTSLRKDEFICECSDIDDIIVIRSDGKMLVTKATAKTFVGKGVIHLAIFKKNDLRTIYNLIYTDGKKGNTFMKRFPVKSITRDKEYDLTSGKSGSKLLYFSANLNGEAETVSVILKSKAKTRNLKFDINFADLAIKTRGVKGNIVSKFPISRVELKHKGVSTLDPQKIWFDDNVQRLNIDQRGDFLGEFAGDDKILVISQTGEYQLLSFELSSHFPEDIIVIEKFDPQKPISSIYWDGSKSKYFVKRFLIEPSDKKVLFISENNGSYLELVSTEYSPLVKIEFSKLRNRDLRDSQQINLDKFISVKGYKSQGNSLSPHKVKSINLLPVIKEPNQSLIQTDLAPSQSSLESGQDDEDTPQIIIDF
ncbi:MAG: DNA topoisomerase IV [Flavobacteriales bacterium]|nr:DNA topoisomerase IV [Flavobacteriales bacterium]|tara:strand:+ start:1965 stop:4574 length:2610 start_codon:yes stop_codon:yes gene_type:complete